VGNSGVDKRIDQIALLIKKGGTIYDLIELEHAYAPPYSSAKDPIAIAGYVAGNIISGAMPVIYWRELTEMDLHEVTLLDVRTPGEFAFGTIRGAINIPVDELRSRLNELPKEKPVIIFCAVGLRGYLALKILQPRGYQTRNLSGGYRLFKAATAKLPQPSA